MPFHKNNDRLRAMLHHHLQMFTGSPYSQKEEQRLFGTRSSIQRWKTVKSVKKLLSKSANMDDEPAFDAIPQLKDRVTKPQSWWLILSQPSLLENIASHFQKSWPDTSLPPFFALNKFAKKHFDVPYFLPDECAPQLRHIEFDDNGLDKSYKTLCAYISANYSDTAIQAERALPHILKHYMQDPTDVDTIRALWGVSALLNTSIIIQYILHTNTDHIEYFKFLNFRLCEDTDCADILELDSVDYDPQYNIFHVNADAERLLAYDSLRSGFALAYQNSKTEFSGCLLSGSVADVAHGLGDIIKLANKAQDALTSDSDGFIHTFLRHTDNLIERACDTFNEAASMVSKEITADSFDGFTKRVQDLFQNIDMSSSDIIRATAPANLDVISDHQDALVKLVNETREKESLIKELSLKPIENKELLFEEISNLTDLTVEIENYLNQVNASMWCSIEDNISKHLRKPDDKQNEIPEDQYKRKDDQLKALRNELFDARRTITTLKSENHNLKQKLSLQKLNSAPSALPDYAAFSAIKNIVETCSVTPLAILESVERLFPDAVIITESAKKSADKVARFSQTKKMFEYLVTLITDYREAINSGKPDAEARTVFSANSYSAQESKTVRSSKRLTQYRTFRYEGNKTTIMFQHLQIGVAINPLQTMRIHFKIINGVVIIGHAGEHLPTC